MRKFLLCLSALFLGVSFANAQTLEYVISPSTGTIANASGKTVSGTSRGCTWTSNSNSPTLTINVTSEGVPVNKMYVMSDKKKHSLDANNNNNAVSYTVSVPEDCGYIITGYSMSFATYQTVTITNEIDNYNETLDGTGKMTASGLNIHSFTFTLSSSNTYGAIDVNENGFIVTLEQESGAPAVEYTVSATASPAEGGSATVNGAAEATTTGKATLVAVPNYGYKFVNWTVDGEVVSTSAEYTDNTDGNKEYVANFAKFADAGEWYASIDKPTFGEAGNTTYIKSATLTDGVEAEVAGIPAEIGQTCVTNAIEVAPGAEFNLNLTYKLNWGDLAIYQLDNDGATKEYGYYFGSWEANGSTAKVAQNIKDAGVSVTEVVDEVCTATFPIRINENHNPGDVIVVRAITGVINDAANSAFEKGIDEGGYVDFLFVVAAAEKAYTLNVTSAGYATMYVDFNAAIAEGVEAYIVKTEGIKGEYIVMTPITGTIPANTGVIVKAAEGDYVFNASEENIANVDGNLLLGSVADEYVEGAAYVLCDKNGIGLYKTILNKNATGGDGETHFKNNANKAYLPASAVPNKSVEFYGFDWSGTTGISEVKGENGNVKTIFDLTGRKVNSITAPGIYIVGGRKVLVK